MTTEQEIRAILDGATVRRDEDGHSIIETATCGECERSWNDAAISSMTPTPSGRCPYEAVHDDELYAAFADPLLPAHVYRALAEDTLTFEELAFTFCEAGDVRLRETLDLMVAAGLILDGDEGYLPAPLVD